MLSDSVSGQHVEFDVHVAVGSTYIVKQIMNDWFWGWHFIVSKAESASTSRVVVVVNAEQVPHTGACDVRVDIGGAVLRDRNLQG